MNLLHVSVLFLIISTTLCAKTETKPAKKSKQKALKQKTPAPTKEQTQDAGTLKSTPKKKKKKYKKKKRKLVVTPVQAESKDEILAKFHITPESTSIFSSTKTPH